MSLLPRLHGAHLVGAALLVGCSSTGVGNPFADQPTVKLSVVREDALLEAEPWGGGASDGGAAGGGAAGGGASDGGAPAGGLLDGGAPGAGDTAPVVTGAAVVVGALHYLPCDDRLPIVDQPGPFVLDLVEGTVQPPLERVAVPGNICALQLDLGVATTPPWLAGRTLSVRGERADGVEFLLFRRVSGRVVLELAEPGLAPATDAVGGQLLLALRPRAWLTERELASVEPVRRDGRFIILVDDAPTLVAALLARLGSESTVHLDVDGDGELSDAERAAPLGFGRTIIDSASER